MGGDGDAAQLPYQSDHPLNREAARHLAEPTIDEFEMALRNEARRAIELLA